MTVVFGREQELALADSFLARARESLGILLLEGDAGIGKTTVWREVVRRADERGFRVLSCRPAETEAKLALSAVSDLLEGAPAEAFAMLPAPQRRALEVALLRAEPTEEPLDPRTLGTAVRSLLTGLSDDVPLLVAIDDVEWLDATSATVLEFALRRLAGTRIGWLFAHRLGETRRVAPDRLAPPEVLTRVTIGPLPLAALHDLVRDRFEQPPSRPLLVRIHRASGGNPFYALEIARELEKAGPDASAAIPMPNDLRKLLSKRIRELPEDTRDALLAASALSHPTTALVDEHALASAEEADLVRIDDDGWIAFRHPLYASAVYETASHTRRRELHRHLAQVVSEPEERARHLSVATSEPDENVATMLEEGADHARSRGAWESSAELLERARDLTPPEHLDDVRRRGIAAAVHHGFAGDWRRSRALLEVILEEPLQGSLRAEALRCLADITIGDGNPAEGKRLLAEALECTDDARIAVKIELALAYVNNYHWDLRRGAVHAHQALERAQATGDAALVAEALAHCALFDFECGRGVDWGKVERSLALEDPGEWVPLHTRPSTIAGLLLMDVDRLSEAHERLTAVRSAALERGDEVALPTLLVFLSWLETRSGDFAAAAALAEEAVSLAALGRSGQGFHATALAHRALVHAHRGDVAKTRRDCAEAAAGFKTRTRAQPSILIPASLGLLELSLGNPAAAWRVCEPHIEVLEQRGVGEPALAPFLPDAIEALVALGELERAERLTEMLAARGRELDRPSALATSARCRGLLIAARHDLAGAAAALDQALVEHERLEMPFELARTLLVLGGVQRRARLKLTARRTLERALEIFELLGARLWAEKTRAELRQIGGRPSRPGALTATEQRIADLVAAGRSNAEVAHELFLSPKTVEWNLSKVYRKLHVRSRTELAARLAQKVPASR